MRRFFAMVFGSFLLANLICWLSVVSILHRLGASEGWEWCLGGFFVLQMIGLCGVVGGRLRGHQPGAGLGRPLLSLFMIWNMLVALPAAVVYLVWALVAWLAGTSADHLDAAWRGAGLFGVAFFPGVAVVATAVALGQLDRFRVRRVRLAIPHLPAALEGLTVAHLSDLHIGKLTRGRVLEKMVEVINGLDADLILVTGDLINMALEDLPAGIALLRRMKSRQGLFLCEGNHDLIESRAGFEAGTKQSGLRFLLNEGAIVPVNGQRIQILGLRWGEERGRPKETVGAVAGGALDRLLAEREPGDFTILLAHHPDAFDAAAQAGIPLTLAGHTHGGQLMLTEKIGFGPWLFRYWSGVYQQGESRMIVSNGAGNWFPLRIHAPAEIIFVTLVGGSPQEKP